jgi:hypothetical protein
MHRRGRVPQPGLRAATGLGRLQHHQLPRRMLRPQQRVSARDERGRVRNGRHELHRVHGARHLPEPELPASARRRPELRSEHLRRLLRSHGLLSNGDSFGRLRLWRHLLCHVHRHAKLHHRAVHQRDVLAHQWVRRVQL